MVFDPTVPDYNNSQFPQEDWRYTPYNGAKEPKSKDYP